MTHNKITKIITCTFTALLLGLFATTANAWKRDTYRSELTDEWTIVLSVDSKKPVKCDYKGNHAKLILQCVENKTSLYIHMGCFVSDNEFWGNVDYRIDKLPFKTRKFKESTSNEALGLWGGRSSIPVIKSMFGHNKLVARVTPYNENSETITFNIAGLEDRIKTLRNVCGW